MIKTVILCLALCCSFSPSLAAGVVRLPYTGGYLMESGECFGATYIFSSQSKRVAVLRGSKECEIYEVLAQTPMRCSLKYLITIYKDETVFSAKGSNALLGKIDLRAKSRRFSVVSKEEALEGWNENTVMQRFLQGQTPSDLVYVGKYHSYTSHGSQRLCGRVAKTEFYTSLQIEEDLRKRFPCQFPDEVGIYIDNLKISFVNNERVCISGKLYERNPEGTTEFFFDETSAKVERQ